MKYLLCLLLFVSPVMAYNNTGKVMSIVVITHPDVESLRKRLFQISGQVVPAYGFSYYRLDGVCEIHVVDISGDDWASPDLSPSGWVWGHEFAHCLKQVND